MSKQKLTPWFVNGEKPTRPGVYQQKNGYGEVGYQRWYRGLWRLWYESPDRASRCITPAADSLQADPWRGIGSDPKAKS